MASESHSDKVIITGMTFYGYHGTRAQEKELGQRFVVDVELEADLRRAGASDDITDTINYSQVYRKVQEIVEGPSQNLMERVAGSIAQTLLESFTAEAVRVRVTKAHPSIKGSMLAGAGVEIYRRRA